MLLLGIGPTRDPILCYSAGDRSHYYCKLMLGEVYIVGRVGFPAAAINIPCRDPDNFTGTRQGFISCRVPVYWSGSRQEMFIATIKSEQFKGLIMIGT